MPHPKAPQPVDRLGEPMVVEMEPLADAQIRGVLCKGLGRGLGRPVLAQQTHMEVPVVG